MKTEVMTLELLSVGKVEGQCLVEVHGRELALRFLPRYAEQVRQELRRLESMVGRNDHVVEPDAHGAPPGSRSPPGTHSSRRVRFTSSAAGVARCAGESAE